MNGTGPDRRRRLRSRALLAVAVAALLGIAAVILTAADKPAAAHAAPQAARNFTLPELGHPGERISLTAYAGRPVIINFFASWCGPCKRETPLLAGFYRAHHGRIAVIGIDSNDESAAAVRFLRSAGASYPVGFDAYPAPAALSYGIVSLPQTFMLNARHQIVQHISGAVTERQLAAWAASLARGGKG